MDDLTYAPIGGSLAPDLLVAPPAGFRSREDRAVLGIGPDVFRRASDAVLRWQLQEGVGIRVHPVDPSTAAATPHPDPVDPRPEPADPRPTASPHPVLRSGDRVVLHIRAYLLTTRAPARVVAVIDEPRRRGFAYGTRRGHPESGEVAFLVEHRVDDVVELVVRSFSRPAAPMWRVLWPFVQIASRRTTHAYLRVLAER